MLPSRIRMEAAKVSTALETSSLPIGLQRRPPKYRTPTGQHPATVNVHGLASPRMRQARRPDQPPPKAIHPYPYNLPPQHLDREHLVRTVNVNLPPIPSKYKPYDLFPTGRNPPISAHSTPGAHRTRLSFEPSLRPDASGALKDYSSPPLTRISNQPFPRTAPKELPYMTFKYGGPKAIDTSPTGHYQTTEQWNEQLAYDLRKKDFDAGLELVSEMRKSRVQCNDETLRLLVAAMELKKVVKEEEQEVSELREVEEGEELLSSSSSSGEVAAVESKATEELTWLPEAKVVFEIATEVEGSTSDSRSWRDIVATIAKAEKKIADRVEELANWENEDARSAQGIAAKPSTSDLILTTTRRLLSSATTRSRQHAINNYYDREAKLAQDMVDIEVTKEVQDHLEAHKKYNLESWYYELRQGWETEKRVWDTVDREIVQPRRSEVSAWVRGEYAMRQRKVEIAAGLRDAEEVVRLAERLVVLPQGIQEDGTVANASSPSGTKPLSEAERAILRRLINKQAFLGIRKEGLKEELSVEQRKKAHLALVRSQLVETAAFLEQLEHIESLSEHRIPTSVWKSLVGKLTAHRAAASASTSALPASEDWQLAFDAARDLYLARSSSPAQTAHPRPNRSLSIVLLDTLLNVVVQNPQFPLAIPTVTSVLDRLLTVADGSSLRASKSPSLSGKPTKTARDNAKLASLLERNAPIYEVLRLAAGILQFARKDLAPGVEAPSFGLLDVELLEAVGRKMGEPGMFELDPAPTPGGSVEAIVEGRKMRHLVNRLRMEIGECVELVWDLREERGTGEGVSRPVRQVVEAEEPEESVQGGETDATRVLEFAVDSQGEGGVVQAAA